MKLKYSDIHTHPFKEYYDDPIKEIEKNIEQDIDKMFFVACSWEEIDEIIELTTKFINNVFPVLGIHPSVVKNENYFDRLSKLITNKTMAIGEIGLDYYRDTNPHRDIQIKALKEQMDVAIKFNLPVMLHIREAFDDIYEIIQQPPYNNLTFIFHTFSGDAIWAQKFLDLGCYLSFSGVVTFKKAFDSKEAVKITPLDKIFIETDAPYLTPVPHRGKRNHSYYIKETYQYISNLKNIPVEKLIKAINENIFKVFNVK